MDRIKTIIAKIKKQLFSMHFMVFLLLLIVGGIPLNAVDRILTSYYQSVIIEGRIANLQTQAFTLADAIGKYQSISANNVSNFANLVQQYSTVNEARILVVNNTYVIELDTYSFDKGKTDLSENVISTFKNRKGVSHYDRETGEIEVTTPVYDSESNIIAVVVMKMNEDEALTFTNTVWQKTYIVKVTLMTLIFLFAVVAAHIVNVRFRSMLVQIRTIALGHYDKRIDGGEVTEFQTMAGDFNDILDKVNSLDASRQEFVSNVSHELKTPITSIKVLADSLNTQEDVPVALYKEFMQDIVDEIDRESKIIDDLLSLVRLDKSAAVLNITSMNINEMLELILKRLKPIAQKKNIELLFESFRPVVAEIDEVKFTIAISNLVENAIKYNNEDGWVHVSLNADHQYFYIRVEDNGIGIPEESQKRVFERFYRVDKARSRQSGGTGLGLAIVQNVILMHHGSIKLHSEDGMGTTFTVRVPLNYIDLSK